MKCYRTLFVTSLAVLLTVFSTACQRNTSGVQAAREEKAARENAMNPAGAGDVNDKNVFSSEDREVAMKIEQANIEEIDLGRYMRDKTNNSDVKDYAKMMIDEHNDALNKLQDLLKKHNVDVSTMSKPEAEALRMRTLQNASGTDLDREYMSMMVQDHQKDLEELQNAEGSVQNPELRSYIQNLIPVVQKHLYSAQELEDNMSKSERR